MARTERILEVVLTTPPLTKNRFVSAIVPLKYGQVLRIVGARQQVNWYGVQRQYLVEVPGVELPPDAPIVIEMNVDGAPPPSFYTRIDH